jgi:acetoin utilization deacetylase AcuC-like enzyme
LIMIASGFDASCRDPLGRMLCTSETYRALTARLLAAADALCAGRLVACHEGGYSETYVPFCGLATIEALAGLRTGVVDPLAERLGRLPGQELLPHQAEVIERAAGLLAGLT